MIAQLRGKRAWVSADQVVVDVGGVGYLVWITGATRTRLPAEGQEVFLHTSLQVREDSMTLYGFAEPAEKQLFEALLGVSGIGPKVALAILSAVTPEQFCRAVAFEDLAALQRLPGVGKKLAGRLVLELKERLAPLPVATVAALAGGAAVGAASRSGPHEATPLSPVPATAWDDALDALATLGYSRPEAATALAAVRSELPPDAAAAHWVRAGLLYLGSSRGRVARP